MRRIALVVALALAATIALGNCSRATKQPEDSHTYQGVPISPHIHCYDARCSSYTVDPAIRLRTKYGIGCWGNVPPGSRPSSFPPPLTYLASDEGKEDVPELTLKQHLLLARIERSIRSKTLRFGFVDDGRQGRADNFIVFDAVDGPCSVAAPGYTVLNHGCFDFYEPGETPYGTHPVMREYECKTPPWGDSTGD